MQKTTHKASILIWSVFMSAIVAIAFMSLSTKINKEIKNHGEIIAHLMSEIQITRLIYNGMMTHVFKDTLLEDGNEIYFSSHKKFVYGLKKYETLNFSFPKNSDISLNMTNMGAIYINIIGNNSQSGMITSSKSLQNVLGTLQMTNLGGYAEISLQSNNDFIPPNSTYTIVKQLGNTQLIINTGEIKNF